MANVPDSEARLRKRQVMLENPRRDGESKLAWWRRLASIVGGNPRSFQQVTAVMEAEAIGRRVREEEQAKMLPVISDFNPEALDVFGHFRGWLNLFGKFQILAQAGLNLARQRGDKYAESFLLDAVDLFERAQRRAGRDGQGSYRPDPTLSQPRRLAPMTPILPEKA